MADRISANKQDEIIRLYNDGLRIRDIANQVGVGSASVFNVLEKRGVKPNRQPRVLPGDETITSAQLVERLLAAERAQVALEAENRKLATRNRRLEAEVARLRLDP